jgi:hypothetical protein
MARVEDGSRGGEQGRSRERTTHGGHPSRRWSGGGGRAATAAERRPGLKHCAGGRGKQSRAARVRGRRREGRGPGDLFGNFKNLKDLSEKQDFPLI